jgi:hypothetical protein
MVEPRRLKPRVSLVLTPEAREIGERLAEARGLSLSTLVETLLREEERRARRRDRSG